MFLLIACLSISTVYSVSHASEFTLLYSNDIRGETEPCG
jgi:hypothetical protein